MVWLLHLGVLGAMDFCHFFLIEGDKEECRVIKALYASMILNVFFGAKRSKTEFCFLYDF